jgi:WD40-like Beta Propeller Repeat
VSLIRDCFGRTRLGRLFAKQGKDNGVSLSRFSAGRYARLSLVGIEPLRDHKISQLPIGNSTNTYPQISPDGRRLAYTSDESGRPEVYVQSFPKLGGKWQVSAGGGGEARWSKDGHQLFYRQGGRMIAVDLQAKSTARGHAPRLLFEGALRAKQFLDKLRPGRRWSAICDVERRR